MNEVIFGTVKSYTDLGMILDEDGVELGSPEPKRTLVDIMGMNGSLDLTPTISEEIRYKNRTIVLTFNVVDYQRRWQTVFSAIMNQIHGQNFNVTIEPDTDYYWDAFCIVNTNKSKKNKGTIVVKLDADPFKYKKTETTVSITCTNTSGTNKTITNGKAPVMPTFRAQSTGMSVKFGNVTHALTRNTDMQFDDIVFGSGNNTITILGTSNGVVKVTFREGML